MLFGLVPLITFGAAQSWCSDIYFKIFFKASQIHRPSKLHPPPAMAPTNTCLRQRTDNAFRVSSLGLSQSFVGNLVLFREK